MAARETDELTTHDDVSRAMADWATRMPAESVETMETVVRLARLGERITDEVRRVHLAAGLEPGDFDVLATLLRNGETAPTELARTLLLSKAGMSGRLARLRERGLVEERAREEDRRGKAVRLAPRGRQIVEGVVSAHVEAEARALSGLGGSGRAQLLDLLRRATAGEGHDGR